MKQTQPKTLWRWEPCHEILFSAVDGNLTETFYHVYYLVQNIGSRPASAFFAAERNWPARGYTQIRRPWQVLRKKSTTTPSSSSTASQATLFTEQWLRLNMNCHAFINGTVLLFVAMPFCRNADHYILSSEAFCAAFISLILAISVWAARAACVSHQLWVVRLF